MTRPRGELYGRHRLEVSPRSDQLVSAFPLPGPILTTVYRELRLSQEGTDQEHRVLGDAAHLPRPWDPGSCTDLLARRELWHWLDEVVAWLNRDYTWDTTDLIPACWNQHPHLVHEIAGLADMRRRAGVALTGEALEEWHRYALPAFNDRVRARVGAHCDSGHSAWPGRAAHSEYTDDSAAKDRIRQFAHDVGVDEESYNT